jgi:hypothetical protein
MATNDRALGVYAGLQPLYGDLHNHCGISYGHGTLEDAFLNAREQLDFCSVTGHALWPDMPGPNPDIDYIRDFHIEGFARLRERWDAVQETTAAFNDPGTFVTFLSFEMHSAADGDRTILYKGDHGDILNVSGLESLHDRIRSLRQQGVEVIAFPHHIGYLQGQRGLNWDTFDPAFAPIVEIISMHGCSEADEVPRPFLHSMGPSDHRSTMQYGLSEGHMFGVVGSTDHHSGHPGSYGHGRTGVWAGSKTRAGIWEALKARRTYALTGDRMALQFAVNGQPMGRVLSHTDDRRIAFHVIGGAPLDAVDIIKNGELLRRFSSSDMPAPRPETRLHTKLFLEVGWGARGERADWDVKLGLSTGRLLSIEPRFRGGEIVSPTELGPNAPDRVYFSHWEPDGSRGVWFRTTTFGNPNNRTPATQGMCLEIEVPPEAQIQAEINGRSLEIPISRLREGALAGRLGEIDSPSYRFHRTPSWSALDWRGEFEDPRPSAARDEVYYLRVRQVNGEWGWSSPVRVTGMG